jgi:hypothetical protein
MLLDTLATWDNSSLWTSLKFEGDDCGLIFHGLMHGSLTIGHNGSYMPLVANNICSCAAVFYCSHKQKYAEVTWAEKSAKQSADNYWVEILGGCCVQLIVKAAIMGQNVCSAAVPKFGCNNMGMVLHATQHRWPLLENQAQSDLLRYFKNLVLMSRIGSKMYHVYGHMDRHRCQSQMALAKRVNVRANQLATEALMEAVAMQTFICSLFPSEGINLMIFWDKDHRFT